MNTYIINDLSDLELRLRVILLSWDEEVRFGKWRLFYDNTGVNEIYGWKEWPNGERTNIFHVDVNLFFKVKIHEIFSQENLKDVKDARFSKSKVISLPTPPPPSTPAPANRSYSKGLL